MSDFYATYLDTGITQDFTVDEHLHINCFRLKLVLWNCSTFPEDFELTLQCKQSTTVLATSVKTWAQMKASDTKHLLTDNHFYGWIKFDFDQQLLLEDGVTYTLDLQYSGSSGFIETKGHQCVMWAIEHEFIIPTLIGSLGGDDSKNQYTFEPYYWETNRDKR